MAFSEQRKNCAQKVQMEACGLELCLYVVLLSGSAKSSWNWDHLGSYQLWKTGCNHQSAPIFIWRFCNLYFKCHYVHAAWVFAAIDLAQVPENGKNSAYWFLYVAFHWIAPIILLKGNGCGWPDDEYTGNCRWILLLDCIPLSVSGCGQKSS